MATCHQASNPGTECMCITCADYVCVGEQWWNEKKNARNQYEITRTRLMRHAPCRIGAVQTTPWARGTTEIHATIARAALTHIPPTR